MKRNAILLQEAYRRDGHVDFIKRASEVCGVPRSTLKKWRQQYLNGIYTEVTNDDIESFRATLWRDQQEIMAHQAFSVYAVEVLLPPCPFDDRWRQSTYGSYRVGRSRPGRLRRWRSAVCLSRSSSVKALARARNSLKASGSGGAYG